MKRAKGVGIISSETGAVTIIKNMGSNKPETTSLEINNVTNISEVAAETAEIQEINSKQRIIKVTTIVEEVIIDNLNNNEGRSNEVAAMIIIKGMIKDKRETIVIIKSVALQIINNKIKIIQL